MDIVEKASSSFSNDKILSPSISLSSDIFSDFDLSFIKYFEMKELIFDSMKINRFWLKLVKKYYETEASGNINLKTVKSIAMTGVDRISIGSITHSAPAIDFKLEI